MPVRPLLILGAATLTACGPVARGTASIAAPAPMVAAEETAGTAAAPIVRQNGEARVDSQPDAGDSAGPVDGPAAPATEAPVGAVPVAPTWDIAVVPYEDHARVEHYVQRYTGPARSWATERLARGTRYESMIRRKLRDGGVPEDLYYLAFVESGFDPNAYSSAAAVGMWQFMPSTARGFGLRVDWWVDERRDPVRSTEAAVRFLRELKEQFGSPYLAAAAYNGGPGRVARGLTRFAGELEGAEGEDVFFALSDQEYLPRETREYVPQLIAAALVGKDPARYGMQVEARDAFAYDSVTVPPLTSLPAMARAAETSIATLRELNPGYLRAVTPPGGASPVRIPAGSAAAFSPAFAALPEDARAGVRRVRITEISSLANVAKKHGTTAGSLRTFNPKMRRTPRGNVAADQYLYVPDADVAAAALDIGDPSLPGGGKSIRYHTVKSGETLGHIAIRNGTTVAEIMRLNGLKKATIFPGQELAVSGKPRAR